MADSSKQLGVAGGPLFILSELRTLLRNRRTVTLAYCFMFAFVAFTVFLFLNPSPDPSSSPSIYPFITNVFGATSPSFVSSSADDGGDSHGSRVSSTLSPNPTSESPRPSSGNVSQPQRLNSTKSAVTVEENPVLNRTQVRDFTGNSSSVDSHAGNASPPRGSNTTQSAPLVGSNPVSNQTRMGNLSSVDMSADNFTRSGGAPVEVAKPGHNQSLAYEKKNDDTHQKRSAGKGVDGTSDEQSQTGSPPMKEQDSGSSEPAGSGKKSAAMADPLESLRKCNFFDGNWVRDDSYPLYKPGSCSLIDEQFNCVLNGRPDKDYQKMKWKPKGCDLPRLDGSKMLELLRGKSLAFVGDSLNRNMWESLVCILKVAAKDQSKVYEANGRMIFRGEASYSFIFKDYGLTIDFFVSPFLVREWEVRNKDGSSKETLRLDLIGKSFDQYKSADIIVFNTGHWWTHDKTSKGEDYYQEGSHVYQELNVLEAFRKALTTWGRWVDAQVDPLKTQVFFRGYSDSHFSGGQWNSGGQCDSETEPIKNSTYLREYPQKMEVLERVLKGMKTPVTYLNVTKMTDYRKDGHPSIYRKQHLTEEERRSPLRFQDCSHWCLPGVPDTWNEIIYAHLLLSSHEPREQKRP
ncbi:hypothetical protein MLD38_035614 [Melastoma candidum]|uniref:Uncharacterized protein n=1 Tax=Melastoma candidum TaxID=119954 RepID=A0ACB9LH23_9MYRT|nr:hypothetical protein MLD38_035614 [Melastoma candidum]